MINRFRGDKGFTLIELLVVIVVIAILIAVAAPSFLGQQDKARESGAQQQLTVAYKAAKAEAVNHNNNYVTDNFREADLVNVLEKAEPQMNFAVAADDSEVTNADTVYVLADATEGDDLHLAYKLANDDIVKLAAVDAGGPVFSTVPATP